LLTLDLLLQLADAGFHLASCGLGRRHVDFRGGRFRLAGLLGQDGALGVGGHDHHQDDHDPDQIAHHVQERVLSGRFCLHG
jgi:hypothetical protein